MVFREQRSHLQNGPDVVGILAECCSSATPALALPVDVGVPFEALFLEVTNRGVTLATEAEAAEATFYSLCPCLVSFSHGGRVMAFLSQIQDWTHADDPPRLVLELPSRLLAMEHRRLFRVPVREDHGLQVSVTADDGRVRIAKPLDITVGGMLVEFDEDPSFAIDTRLRVAMSLEEDAAEVAGLVRHRRDRRYGLSFYEIVSQGRIRPSEVLLRIVRRLEERWLGTTRSRGLPPVTELREP
jgi:c-di-GMP-binding flagellar brake protein YcgR